MFPILNEQYGQLGKAAGPATAPIAVALPPAVRTVLEITGENGPAFELTR